MTPAPLPSVKAKRGSNAMPPRLEPQPWSNPVASRAGGSGPCPAATARGPEGERSESQGLAGKGGNCSQLPRVSVTAAHAPLAARAVSLAPLARCRPALRRCLVSGAEHGCDPVRGRAVPARLRPARAGAAPTKRPPATTHTAANRGVPFVAFCHFAGLPSNPVSHRLNACACGRVAHLVYAP